MSNQSSDHPVRKIVWALDALLEDKSLVKKTETILAALTKNVKTEIEPVYILCPDDLAITTELTPPWIKSYKPNAEKALRSLVSKVKLDSIKESQVIVQTMPGIRRSVDSLIAHAKLKGADLIVVSTNARKGMPRFILGSFAETLLLHSEVPVFIINPSMTEPKKFNRILFPTDLEEASRTAFETILSLCKGLDAKITLFHKIPNPIEPVVASGAYLLGGAWVPVSTYFDQTTQARETEAKKWVDYAKSKGIKADCEIDQSTGSTVQAILKYAKKSDTQMIAMASRSGAVATALLGSISRQVVRQATCPVWIMHPKPIQQKKQKKPAGPSVSLFS
jgi:nucleotide-binding universal stress UspA family protein